MRPFIGVSPDLAPVASALRAEGYDVVDLPRGGPEGVHGLDAIVVSGQGSGLLGVWRTDPPVPLVNADGKTAGQVVSDIAQMLAARGQGR